MSVKYKLSFDDAVILYKQGCRIQSLVTGMTYIDYKHDANNTKFRLSEIDGKWTIVE